MSANVFINYRREDTAQAAGRIYDRLAQAFGRENIFMDIDKIPYGNDFTAHIRTQFDSCKIVVALIGPKWLTIKRGSWPFSKRRIDEATDWVRTELELALSKSTPIIPVLVDGARMPSAKQLPASLSSLASRNGLGLRHEHFLNDVEALISSVGGVLSDNHGVGQSEAYGLVSINAPMRRDVIDLRYRQRTVPDYAVRLVASPTNEAPRLLGPEQRPYVMVADYDELRGRPLKSILDGLFVGVHFDAINSSNLSWKAVVYRMGSVNLRAYDLLPATWKAVYRICTDQRRLALWEADSSERAEIGSASRDYWVSDESRWETRLVAHISHLIELGHDFGPYSIKPRPTPGDVLVGLFGIHGCFAGGARGPATHGGFRIFLQKNMELSDLESRIIELGTIRDNNVLS